MTQQNSAQRQKKNDSAGRKGGRVGSRGHNVGGSDYRSDDGCC